MAAPLFLQARILPISLTLSLIHIYYRKRREAIEALSSVLWGYTSKDSLDMLEPVSYTHLDVYKRQNRCRGRLASSLYKYRGRTTPTGNRRPSHHGSE